MRPIEEILDVGHQGSAEGGMFSYPEHLCITCGAVATAGSWCVWHHPATTRDDLIDLAVIDPDREAIVSSLEHLIRQRIRR